MKSWIQASLFTIVGIIAPIKALVLVVLFLVIVDMITGIWASMKRGEAFKSAALRRTVSKLLVYQIAIITGFLVEIYLIDKMLPASKMIGGIVGFVEFSSILENLNTIYGTNLFKVMLTKLGSVNDLTEVRKQNQLASVAPSTNSSNSSIVSK